MNIYISRCKVIIYSNYHQTFLHFFSIITHNRKLPRASQRGAGYLIFVSLTTERDCPSTFAG